MIRLIISCGDPNGIGIETMLKGIKIFDDTSEFSENCMIAIASDIDTIISYSEKIGLTVQTAGNNIIISKRKCEIADIGLRHGLDFGKISAESGGYAARSIEYSVNEVMNGRQDAIVTMPVNKASLYLAGWKFPGHTEMLADSSGGAEPLMILCSGGFRVALATVHEPIKIIPELITKELILNKLKIFNHSLKIDFGIAYPKIAVMGLNPHAGEEGSIGREEIEEIIPAIREACKSGIITEGPFPADGFFAHGSQNHFDGILAMYHDQGLIPVKMESKGNAVNVTAGLPLVRTSPGHGTAFDIAGKGIAEGISASAAIELACRIAANRKAHTIK